MRISLSEVLAAFFAEGQGEEGVYRGLSLIGRCRDAGLPPYPFDFLGAMRVCTPSDVEAACAGGYQFLPHNLLAGSMVLANCFFASSTL